MGSVLITILLLLRLALAGVLTVEVLDVGQGDAILIRSPKGKTVLVDAGPPEADVAAMLRRRGVETIDLAVVTHPHADHIGGMPDVLTSFEVKSFADSGVPHTTAAYNRTMQLVEEKGIPYRAARVGHTWRMDDGIVLEVLHPSENALTGTRSDHNSNSVVIRLTHGDDCFLFLGDAEEPTEQALLARGLLPCDVLKVPHHGGAHSSTKPFLEALSPQIAVISCGRGNSYRHPRPEALERLAAVGADVYRTDQVGTVKLSSNKRRISATSAPEPGAGLVDVTTLSSVPVGHDDGRARREHRGFRLFRKRPSAAPSNAAIAAPRSPPPTVVPATTAAPAGRLDLNTATLPQLDQLPGIGPSKAAAILTWRAEHGTCTDVEQLDAIPGIGPGTIEQIRGLVQCGDADTAPLPSP